MPPTEKPYFRFTHSKPLRKRTLKILDAIDRDDDPTVHRKELSDNIIELFETGMSFFILNPLAKLKMGFVVEQSAKVGVASSLRVMAPVVRQVVGRMNKKQLRQLSKEMRRMMK